MNDSDIQVEYAGQRMRWWAASERGRAWVAAHPSWTRQAPEREECLAAAGDVMIARALIAGLVVMAGDVELTLT